MFGRIKDILLVAIYSEYLNIKHCAKSTKEECIVLVYDHWYIFFFIDWTVVHYQLTIRLIIGAELNWILILNSWLTCKVRGVQVELLQSAWRPWCCRPPQCFLQIWRLSGQPEWDVCQSQSQSRGDLFYFDQLISQQKRFKELPNDG